MVDPYRDHLRTRREQEPGVGATTLLAEIRALGYTGSHNLHVRHLCPEMTALASVVRSFARGSSDNTTTEKRARADLETVPPGTQS